MSTLLPFSLWCTQRTIGKISCRVSVELQRTSVLKSRPSLLRVEIRQVIKSVARIISRCIEYIASNIRFSFLSVVDSPYPSVWTWSQGQERDWNTMSWFRQIPKPKQQLFVRGSFIVPIAIIVIWTNRKAIYRYTQNPLAYHHSNCHKLVHIV